MPAPRKSSTKTTPDARPSRTPGAEGRTSAATREAKQDPLNILTVAPEAAPFAKTGGLADVAGALPLALSRLGHSVTVVLPRYRGVEAGEDAGSIELRLGGRAFPVRYGRVQAGERVTFAFVDVPELFDREALYGIGSDDYPDN